MEEVNVESWRSVVSSQNPELLKKAQEELYENPDQRDQEIEKFRKMILANQELTSPTDDAFLLRFLRARKFDHSRALKLLHCYFAVRLTYPNLFAAFRPSENIASLNENLQAILPQRDQMGRRIHLVRFGRWDPNISTVDQLFRVLFMGLESVLSEEETQVHGVVAIFDMKYYRMAQARHATPTNAKKAVTLIQDCLPARFKGFHVIYEPIIVDAVYQFVKQFLSPKIKSRVSSADINMDLKASTSSRVWVFFHGQNLESLHKHILPEHLPEELGGLQPPTDYSVMTSSLQARDDEIANAVANFGFLRHEKGCDHNNGC